MTRIGFRPAFRKPSSRRHSARSRHCFGGASRGNPRGALVARRASSCDMKALVSFDSVTKRFGHTEALGDLSLSGIGGTVHAVTGENGAGKSTLMNLLAGVYHPDSGTIRLRGKLVKFESPAQARRAGISSIFQEL